MNKHTFWLDDIKVLYKNNKYLHFLPSNSMNKVEKLNSIARFAIYSMALILLFGQNVNWIYIPMIILIITIILHKNNFLDYYLDLHQEIDEDTIVDIVDTANQNNPYLNYLPFSEKNNATETHSMIDHDLYRNIDDVFDKKNSDRQFYTLPSNDIVNDQSEVAKWLYNTSYESCKVNSENCFVNDRERF